MKKTIIIILSLQILFLGCKDSKEKLYQMYHEQVASVGSITDEMLVKYIRTYKILRKNGRNYLQLTLQKSNALNTNSDAYQKIIADVKQGGFNNYTEFVKVNAKIAWAWNMAQAKIGMHKQKSLYQWGNNQLDGGIQQMKDAINDPDVPEESKVELRKGLQELLKGKRDYNQQYKKNLFWANKSMNLIKPLTNEKDINVILRHEKELMEVFTGLSKKQLDQIQEASMKQLGIE